MNLCMMIEILVINSTLNFNFIKVWKNILAFGSKVTFVTSWDNIWFLWTSSQKRLTWFQEFSGHYWVCKTFDPANSLELSKKLLLWYIWNLVYPFFKKTYKIALHLFKYNGGPKSVWNTPIHKNVQNRFSWQMHLEFKLSFSNIINKH